MEKKQRGKRLAEYRTDYVVFDLETTGLSPVSDAIVEISGIKVKAGKVTGNFSMLDVPFLMGPSPFMELPMIW